MLYAPKGDRGHVCVKARTVIQGDLRANDVERARHWDYRVGVRSGK